MASSKIILKKAFTNYNLNVAFVGRKNPQHLKTTGSFPTSLSKCCFMN